MVNKMVNDIDLVMLEKRINQKIDALADKVHELDLELGRVVAKIETYLE